MEECYMKISVVIAYHDEKQYIKDCLASLAEQTFQDFEVILVCDGCEAPEEGIPETLNIVTVMQEEKGVAGARNASRKSTQRFRSGSADGMFTSSTCLRRRRTN